MGHSATVSQNPHNDGITKGWQGQLSLEFAYSPQNSTHDDNRSSASPDHEGMTRLLHSHGIAPLKIQRPFYPEGPHVCHSVIVHTAGGMVGGDRLSHSLSLHPSAHALVTTAAASKAYKSNGYVAHQATHATVATGGCLEWLPQPLIVFNGAQYHQHLHIDLAPDAIWMGWDITRLGRTLRGETFDQGEWRSRLEIWQNGFPLWIDSQHIQGGGEMLTSQHGLASCPVIGTFAILGIEPNNTIVHQMRQLWSDSTPADTGVPATTDRLEPRKAQDHHEGMLLDNAPIVQNTGVSQLQTGLICRYRGHSTIIAQRWFIQVWNLLRQTYLARPSCTPRVWQIRE